MIDRQPPDEDGRRSAPDELPFMDQVSFFPARWNETGDRVVPMVQLISLQSWHIHDNSLFIFQISLTTEPKNDPNTERVTHCKTVYGIPQYRHRISAHLRRS